MTGLDVPFSASALWGWDMVITPLQTTTIKGANGAIMASLPANQPFYVPGTGHQQWGDEPQINLADYSANAGSGTVYIAYSVRM